MSHAMYTALSGAVAQERALEVVADNLANVSTQGFKGTRLTFRQVLMDADGRPAISQAEVQVQQNMAQARAKQAAKTAAGSQALGAADTRSAATPGAQVGAQAPSLVGQPHVQVEVAGAYVDMSPGPLKITNNPLDFALTGAGFFAVQTPAGERLTRQGSFVVNSEGTLVTLRGHAVQGGNGPIRMHPESEVQVDASGGIFADGMYVDTLKRVNVATSKDLLRQGDSLFSVAAGGRVDVVDTPLQNGALEQSNVNAVSAMTQLIGVQRAYESYHRALETIQGLEQKTSSQLG